MARTRAPNAKRKATKPPAVEMPTISVDMADPMALGPTITPSGAVEIPFDDGSVIIDLSPAWTPDPEVDTSQHDANLARVLPDGVLGRIAEDLLDGIAADNDSRSEWLNARTQGLDMLAIKVEKPRSGTGSGPLEGMSVVRDPIMLEAVLRFQANAQGEMLPASGPVKVVDYGTADTRKLMLAERLEKDLNYYLTSVASEYYPDTRRMFWETGFSGLAFKKVYKDPLKRRPVSETVPAEHLIVSDAITDLRSAQRITHQIRMKKSTMRRMQIAGVYRDVRLTDPNYSPNAYDEKVARIQGLAASPERPEDQLYEVYECYCELDIEGFEHEDKKGPTGLPLPYRVTIEKETREILEIRRNWSEDDPDFLAKIPFVAYPYATGPGFWGLGLLHILGNPTAALTAMLREAIDASMFANFPGGMVSKLGTRQMSNDFRIGPGEFAPVETGGMPIRDVVMGLPYKPVDASHVALMSQLREVTQRLGGTADTPVGEGRQDAPVGTTLAMIEQATKVEGAVLKALHAAQAEEFKLLVDLFRDDPESLWRGNRRSALGKDVALFKQALEICDIVPKSDPNVPSRLQRLAVAEVIKKMAEGAPQRYDLAAVDRRVLSILGVDNPDELFAKTPAKPPQPDPLKVAELQIRAKEAETKKLKVELDAANKAADRESQQNLAVLELANTVGVHPESNAIVDEQIMQLAPLMSNIVPSMTNPTRAAGPPMRSVPVPGLGGMGRPPMRFAPPPARYSYPAMPNGAFR